MGALAGATFFEAHATAETAATRSVPAILEVSSARTALVAADRAAIESFQTGEVQLTGPGEAYRNQLAIASQSLAQVAEDNVAGEAGSQILRLVEGLLVAYTGAIEQAAAQSRQPDNWALAIADLWSASRLLHAPSTGILAQLNELRQAQSTALDQQQAAGPLGTAITLSWLVPTVVLLSLLVLTQVYVNRRFRRTISPPLAVATLCLLALAAIAWLGVVSRDRLAGATLTLDQLVTDIQAQDTATDATGQRDLARLIKTQCPQGVDDCGSTVARFVAALPPAGSASVQTDDTLSATPINDQVAAAGQHADLLVGILVTSVAVMALVVFGLNPRISEYRYRS